MKRSTLVLAILASLAGGAADVTVDFAKPVGSVNPLLHSSGCAPRLYPRAIRHDDADIRAMGFHATRTHDWALWNAGQRIVDTHFVFPLMHLDAKDPKNYFFKATDEALKFSKDLGLKIFYRMGSSIEHTEGVHFNVLDPADHEKYAEVLAGIMRHYLKGWADGFTWTDAFQGWEIWNEPDGITNCFVMPDCEETDGTKRRAIHQTEFCRLFVTVLKRLKSEFPDQQIGGPALCWANEKYFRELLQGCRDAGVAPDFISWHGYTSDPDGLLGSIPKMRALLDEFGFRKTRMNINEWHYIRTWNGIHGRDSAPVAIRRAHEGPSGHNSIDSAAFNVYLLAKFQDTCLDEAYWYGSAPIGNWGWLNGDGTLNKCWYSMKLFGDFVRAAQTKVETKVDARQKTVAAIAGLSADGRTASLVVSDYRGKNEKLKVSVKGLEGVKGVSAVVLDHTRDLSVIPVDYRDGELTLSRLDENSAAYLVTFELGCRAAGAKGPRKAVFGPGQQDVHIREICAFAGKKRPKTLVFETAEGDAESEIAARVGSFKAAGADVEPVRMHKAKVDPVALRRKILEADILWFGCGVAEWLLNKIDFYYLEDAIKEAYRNGTVLCGNSAGSLIQAYGGYNDFSDGRYDFMRGLGIIRAYFVPHYQAEQFRKGFEERLAKETDPATPNVAWAVENGAGVFFVNEKPEVRRIVGKGESPQAKAYRFIRTNGKWQKTEVPPANE